MHTWPKTLVSPASISQTNVILCAIREVLEKSGLEIAITEKVCELFSERINGIKIIRRLNVYYGIYSIVLIFGSSSLQAGYELNLCLLHEGVVHVRIQCNYGLLIYILLYNSQVIIPLFSSLYILWQNLHILFYLVLLLSCEIQIVFQC